MGASFECKVGSPGDVNQGMSRHWESLLTSFSNETFSKTFERFSGFFSRITAVVHFCVSNEISLCNAQFVEDQLLKNCPSLFVWADNVVRDESSVVLLSCPSYQGHSTGDR